MTIVPVGLRCVSRRLRRQSVAPVALNNPNAKQEPPQALGKQKVSEPLSRIYIPVLGRVSGICVETVVFKFSAAPKQ